MNDSFLTTATARLTALIEDQHWLLDVIRKEKAELVVIDERLPVQPSTLPTPM
jgi:hypothetical protein